MQTRPALDTDEARTAGPGRVSRLLSWLSRGRLPARRDRVSKQADTDSAGYSIRGGL